MKPQLAAITKVGSQNVSHEFYHFKERRTLIKQIKRYLPEDIAAHSCSQLAEYPFWSEYSTQSSHPEF